MLDVLYLSLQNTLHPFPPCSVHGEADWYGFYQQKSEGRKRVRLGIWTPPDLSFMILGLVKVLVAFLNQSHGFCHEALS